MGVQDAAERLGVDAAYAIDELDARLPHYLYGASRLFYALGHDEAFDRRMQQVLAAARSRARRVGSAPEAIYETGKLLHEMRLFKDSGEVAKMRRAAAITAQGHRAGMIGTRPGMREYEVEALIEYEYLRAGERMPIRRSLPRAKTRRSCTTTPIATNSARAICCSWTAARSSSSTPRT